MERPIEIPTAYRAKASYLTRSMCCHYLQWKPAIALNYLIYHVIDFPFHEEFPYHFVPHKTTDIVLILRVWDLALLYLSLDHVCLTFAFTSSRGRTLFICDAINIKHQKQIFTLVKF